MSSNQKHFKQKIPVSNSKRATGHHFVKNNFVKKSTCAIAHFEVLAEIDFFIRNCTKAY